jgi:ADP-ribose pyrophosphatase
MPAMPAFQTLNRRTVARFGRFLSLEDRAIRLPDGRIIRRWPWVRTPDYVNILARTTDGLFPILRLRKYAVRGLALAPPGGYVEPDESPLAAARRELREEAALRAPRWIRISACVVDSNRGAGTAHFFLALDARPCPPAPSDDLEAHEMLWLNRRELEAALDAGRFRVLAWPALVALGLRRLDRA